MSARKQERIYLVRERLVGLAEYEIPAKSKKEALQRLRRGEHDEMLNSVVNHTGRAFDIKLLEASVKAVTDEPEVAA